MIQLSPAVWVVDDEEVNRELARAYLEHIGWSVKEFSSGTEVLRALRSQHPQAVLLDLRMPGVSGLELISQIRSQCSHQELKIVCYTAYSIKEYLENVIAAGSDSVLIKPVTFRQMSEALPLLLASSF